MGYLNSEVWSSWFKVTIDNLFVIIDQQSNFSGGDNNTLEQYKNIYYIIYFLLTVIEFLLSGISDAEPRFTSYMKTRDLNPNPLLKAGIFSRIFFVWLIGLIYKGYKNPLEGKDVYDLPPDQKANEVYGSFHKELKKGLISFDSKNIDKFIR